MGDAGRSMANTLGLMGGIIGLILAFAVAAVGAVAGDPAAAVVLAMYVAIYGAPGLILPGLVIGLTLDSRRARRDRAAKGFENVAWVAVLELRDGLRTVTAGNAFLGAGRLLFASRKGDRLVVQPQHVETIRALEETRAELDLTAETGAAKLVLVGLGASAAAARMLEGGMNHEDTKTRRAAFQHSGIRSLEFT